MKQYSKSEALQKAIAIAGGQSALARLLSNICGKNIRQAHIFNWLNRDKEIPAEYVIPIEIAVKKLVTRYELRPDIYPPTEESIPKKD